MVGFDGVEPAQGHLTKGITTANPSTHDNQRIHVDLTVSRLQSGRTHRRTGTRLIGQQRIDNHPETANRADFILRIKQLPPTVVLNLREPRQVLKGLLHIGMAVDGPRGGHALHTKHGAGLQHLVQHDGMFAQQRPGDVLQHPLRGAAVHRAYGVASATIEHIGAGLQLTIHHHLTAQSQPLRSLVFHLGGNFRTLFMDIPGLVGVAIQTPDLLQGRREGRVADRISRGGHALFDEMLVDEVRIATSSKPLIIDTAVRKKTQPDNLLALVLRHGLHRAQLGKHLALLDFLEDSPRIFL